jgi:hypothetical protein
VSVYLSIITLCTYFEAKDPVNKEWNSIMVSSRSQIKTRSTWDSGSGLWLFRLFELRLLDEGFRAESESVA